MPSFVKKERLFLLGLLALGVLVYKNSLHGPLIGDDQYTVVWNFPLRDLSQIGKIVTQNLFAAAGTDTAYFRPLTQLSFALDFNLWGFKPVGYRLTSLVIHLGNALLVYRLAQRFLPSAQSFLVSLLFIAHPANMQAVAYISSRSDPLFVFFTLLSVNLWLTDKGLSRSFCLLSFFLGLSSKEPAVVTLPLVLLMDLARSESYAGAKRRLQNNWLWYIGLAGILFAYLALRVWILGYPLLMEAGQVDFTLPQRLMLALTLLGKHLVLLLFPVNLAFIHMVVPPDDFFAPEVLGPLLTVIGLGYLALKLWKMERAVALGLAWFLIADVPALNLTLLNLPLMESWLYLPGVGLFIFLVSLGGLAVNHKAIRILAACMTVVLLTMRATVRSADWGSPVRLFEKNVQLYPRSDIAWSSLASAYVDVGRDKEGLEAARKVVELRPDLWTSHFGLGLRYFWADEDKGAEQSLLTATGLNPYVAWPHYLLGITYFRSGLWEKARQEFLKASLGEPHIPMLYHVIGSCYLALGERGLAEEAFQSALKEYPRKKDFHSNIHTDLGGALKKRGLLVVAKQEYELALRFDPENKEAMEKLASLK